MADGVAVRSPSATASLQGGDVKVDSVTASFGINSFPTVRVGFHDSAIPSSGVLRMAGTDVAARVGQQQSSMFEAQSANSTVSMSDGNDNSLNFSGYISGPEYSLGVQAVGFTTSIVHAAAAITNLNTSIYTNKLGTWRDGDSPMTTNIGESLIGVLDLLKKKQDPGLPDEESKAIVAQIDTNNAPAYEIWKKICSSSSVEWPELETLLEYPQIDKNLSDMVAGAYLNSYNDFFQTMQQFQAMFSMIYVPGLGGEDMGKFVGADAAMEDGSDLSVSIRSIRMAAGPKSILPLAYVVVRGPKPQNHRDTQYGHIVQRWPKEAQSSGQVVELGTPSWLPSAMVAGRPTSTTVGDTLDLNAYESGQIDSDKELYEVIFPDVGKLLERWAKQHYLDFALASSYAEIVTDMDLSIAPGVRYNVSSPNGTLFSGFLVNVEHGLSSKPQSLQAYTRLYFTHIEAGDFSLPGK